VSLGFLKTTPDFDCAVVDLMSRLTLLPLAAEEGLPAGLSFIARPYDEPSIIRAAYAYEQATQHREPPPIFLECFDPQNGTGAAFIQQAGK